MAAKNLRATLVERRPLLVCEGLQGNSPGLRKPMTSSAARRWSAIDHNKENGMARVQPSRREMLGGLIATGLTAGLAALRADEKPPAGKRFDFHHHFFVKGIAKYARKFPGSSRLEDWTPAKSIEAMDAAGIGTTFLTMPGGMGPDPAALKDECIALAREVNDS